MIRKDVKEVGRQRGIRKDVKEVGCQRGIRKGLLEAKIPSNFPIFRARFPCDVKFFSGRKMNARISKGAKASLAALSELVARGNRCEERFDKETGVRNDSTRKQV